MTRVAALRLRLRTSLQTTAAARKGSRHDANACTHRPSPNTETAEQQAADADSHCLSKRPSNFWNVTLAICNGCSLTHQPLYSLYKRGPGDGMEDDGTLTPVSRPQRIRSYAPNLYPTSRLASIPVPFLIFPHYYQPRSKELIIPLVQRATQRESDTSKKHSLPIARPLESFY